MKILYWVSLLVGIGIAGYLFGYAFDSMGETELVRMTTVWFFPLVFGIYGLVAEKMIAWKKEGKIKGFGSGIVLMSRVFGLVGVVVFGILLIPFAFVKWKNSLIVALVGTIFWAGLLAIFFEVIWQLL